MAFGEIIYQPFVKHVVENDQGEPIMSFPDQPDDHLFKLVFMIHTSRVLLSAPWIPWLRDSKSMGFCPRQASGVEQLQKDHGGNAGRRRQLHLGPTFHDLSRVFDLIKYERFIMPMIVWNSNQQQQICNICMNIVNF